ncbi:MAG TPA: septum formation protein Maf [Gammaproteobacteria bacterium]|nr:septum formation protein Maf [Gammaproteobacteria bacterium]
MSPRLILASGSPYRRELLSRLGLPFTVQSPGVDEHRLDGEAPAAMALRLAEAKARAVAAGLETGLVIASDQVAALDDEILGKPGGFEAARAQLERVSGRSLCFHTALCLLDAASGRLQLDSVPCEARFRPLERTEIEHYLRREQPYDCAGAFKSEGLGIALLEALHCEDPTAIIGLPLIRLCGMLREVGVDVFRGVMRDE